MRVAWMLLFDMSLKNLRFLKRQNKSCEIFVKKNTLNRSQSMCQQYLGKKHMKNNVVIRQRVLIYSQLEKMW